MPFGEGEITLRYLLKKSETDASCNNILSAPCQNQHPKHRQDDNRKQEKSWSWLGADTKMLHQ